MEVEEFAEEMSTVVTCLKSGDDRRAIKKLGNINSKMDGHDKEIEEIKENIDNENLDEALLLILRITDDVEESN